MSTRPTGQPNGAEHEHAVPTHTGRPLTPRADTGDATRPPQGGDTNRSAGLPQVGHTVTGDCVTIGWKRLGVAVDVVYSRCGTYVDRCLIEPLDGGRPTYVERVSVVDDPRLEVGDPVHHDGQRWVLREFVGDGRIRIEPLDEDGPLVTIAYAAVASALCMEVRQPAGEAPSVCDLERPCPVHDAPESPLASSSLLGKGRPGE